MPSSREEYLKEYLYIHSMIKEPNHNTPDHVAVNFTILIEVSLLIITLNFTANCTGERKKYLNFISYFKDFTQSSQIPGRYGHMFHI